MPKAKADYDERMKKAAAIKAEIDKVLAAVNDANACLQVNRFFYIYLEKDGQIYRQIERLKENNRCRQRKDRERSRYIEGEMRRDKESEKDRNRC